MRLTAQNGQSILTSAKSFSVRGKKNQIFKCGGIVFILKYVYYYNLSSLPLGRFLLGGGESWSVIPQRNHRHYKKVHNNIY